MVSVSAQGGSPPVWRSYLAAAEGVTVQQLPRCCSLTARHGMSAAVAPCQLGMAQACRLSEGRRWCYEQGVHHRAAERARQAVRTGQDCCMHVATAQRSAARYGCCRARPGRLRLTAAAHGPTCVMCPGLLLVGMCMSLWLLVSCVRHGSRALGARQGCVAAGWQPLRSRGGICPPPHHTPAVWSTAAACPKCTHAPPKLALPVGPGGGRPWTASVTHCPWHQCQSTHTTPAPTYACSVYCPGGFPCASCWVFCNVRHQRSGSLVVM